MDRLHPDSGVFDECNCRNKDNGDLSHQRRNNEPYQTHVVVEREPGNGPILIGFYFEGVDDGLGVRDHAGRN